jgi:hypothetical protein
VKFWQKNIIVASLFFSVFALADGTYRERPDVFAVEPHLHENLIRGWDQMRKGHTEAVAQILGMYPDRQIYFLARDSELLYDLARVLNRDDPKTLARIHLLNVSRANMEAPDLHNYLEQEGLGLHALESGKKVLFVDTGFRGTIPAEISRGFPPRLEKQLQTHLLSSSNNAHPSSRVFLNSLSNRALKERPSNLENLMMTYENLPRYTDRSTSFAKVDGHWQPMHAFDSSHQEGIAAKDQARLYMEDIHAYGLKNETQNLYQTRKKLWTHFRKIADDTSLSKSQLVDHLQAILKRSNGDLSIEAAVKDFLDLKETNFTEGPRVFGSDLGFQGWNANPRAAILEEKTEQAMRRYPKWAKVIEDPNLEFATMIRKHQFSKINAITAAVSDDELTTALAKQLGKAEPTGALKNYLRAQIKKPNFSLLKFEKFTFNERNSAQLADELKLLKSKLSSTSASGCGLELIRNTISH